MMREQQHNSQVLEDVLLVIMHCAVIFTHANIFVLGLDLALVRRL